jgi:uncharacterized membrane protein YeaQ/YmgE (transglycosylase-associated protein family)
MTIAAFLLFVISACACAWIAEYFMPKRIPGGFFTGTMIGLLGAWIGANLLGKFGPSLAGVALLPTLTGSAVLVSTLAMLSKLYRSA